MSEFEKYWEENASKETWANKTVAWNIWQEKQAKIDDSENTRAVLYRENTDIREKNTDLQAKIELLEKEITETQAFLNNQNHIKQAKIDELQKRIDDAVGLIKPLYRNEFNQRSNADIHISKFREIEKALRGERD